MIVVELAKRLHAAGIVVFDETGTSGDAFIGRNPSEPDESVALTPYPGPPSDSGLPYDLESFQVRIRSAPFDPRPGINKAKQIYDALHGLRAITLADGTYLVSCLANHTSPAPLGPDGNNRDEWTLSFTTEVRNNNRV